MTEPGPAGCLYVVSTPIGNLEDITHRAVNTLRSVDAVLAEDTRHSRHLLAHYGIETPLEPYHEHNEARAAPRLLARLREGARLALISDAGTPLLSDPGARLVHSLLIENIPVVAVPGPSALLAALVGSGMDASRFTFYGFLPRKGAERASVLRELAGLEHTAVIYEAPARVAGTLDDIARSGGGERQVAVARELTKRFEETRRGTVSELARYYGESAPRGEVVIVLAGASRPPLDEDAIRAAAERLRADGVAPRDVVRQLIEEHGAPRNLAYRLAHDLAADLP